MCIFGNVTGSGGKELLNGGNKKKDVHLGTLLVVEVVFRFLVSAKAKDGVICLVNL